LPRGVAGRLHRDCHLRFTAGLEIATHWWLDELFLVRKCAGNGEKLLLPLQIKLAKDVDEIVYAIFYGRDAITTFRPRRRLAGICRFDDEVRGQPERRNAKVICDPGQQQLGSLLRTCFIEKVLIRPDPELSGNALYA
jgi:hypothetical protein